MVLLKVYIGLRRTVSLVMIIAIIQAGLLGRSVPVLAQSGNTLSDAVYQFSNMPSEVATRVYAGEGPGAVGPPPLTFLQNPLLDLLAASSGSFAVSGQVTENSTGMPLTGVTIRLLLDGHPTQFKANTDSQGSYTLTGVGTGKYLLNFQHPGYATEKFGINVSAAAVKQDCALFRNSSFKGQVENEYGDSLAGVQVTFADQNTPDRGMQLSTDVDGRFNLVEVPPGRYRFSVSQAVYHKQKTVWIDEYPQELVMILAGGKPLPLSVAEKVYQAIPADVVPVDEQPDAETPAEQPSTNSQPYPDVPGLKGNPLLTELEQLLKQQAVTD